MSIGRTSGPSGAAAATGADRTSGVGKFGAFKAALGTAADKVGSFFRGLGSALSGPEPKPRSEWTAEDKAADRKANQMDRTFGKLGF